MPIKCQKGSRTEWNTKQPESALRADTAVGAPTRKQENKHVNKTLSSSVGKEKYGGAKQEQEGASDKVTRKALLRRCHLSQMLSRSQMYKNRRKACPARVNSKCQGPEAEISLA